ncbi:MAG: flagellar filament capping protein FliD [Acetatifactor sp.]|nr:flagellar filament capping protein FliD [Acetatifactor sp.]
MPMRLSGLMSGMDTESVIQQLVAARRTKVDTAVKAQTKLQWKTDAWKSLNTKIKKLYDGALSNLRFEGSYMKKTTKVSNSSVVSVITGDNAMNTVQTLKVTSLAKSAYLTGGEIGKGELKLDADSRIAKLGGYDFSDQGKINVTVGDKRTEIVLTGATTMGEIVQAFRDAGLNASFDTTNQRFYISSKDTGEKNDFTISAGDLNGLAMLTSLGLAYADGNITGYYDNIINQDVQATVNSRLQGRTDKRVNELYDQLAELSKTNRELHEGMSDFVAKYEDEFSDVDTSEPGAVRQRIKELVEEDAEKYSDLAEWEEKVAKVRSDIADIESQYEVNDEGKTVLTEEGKEKLAAIIKKEVEAEIENATNMRDILINASKETGANKQKAEDAVIELNGVRYQGSRNTFEINGLTLTLNATTGDEKITLTTQDDTDGIYDMIKNFIKEYSELINEMDKLYNAEAAKDYEPLTSEEKESMSEKEIEEWETKIKDSILRRDDTLGTISSALKQMMLTGITVNGRQMSLATFGIGSLSYFTAAENEKNALHIDGDPDDPNTSGNEDKLKAMIAADPQTVVDFFVEFSRSMYKDLTDRMAKTEYSSAYTIYEDVKMKSEYDAYTSKIAELEAKLADYEDKWYAKFAKMETALSKLQSNASAVTSLLGG